MMLLCLIFRSPGTCQIQSTPIKSHFVTMAIVLKITDPELEH